MEKRESAYEKRETPLPFNIYCFKHFSSFLTRFLKVTILMCRLCLRSIHGRENVKSDETNEITGQEVDRPRVQQIDRFFH